MEILQLLTRKHHKHTLPERTYSFSLQHSFFHLARATKTMFVKPNFGKFLKDFDHFYSLLNKQLQQRT